MARLRRYAVPPPTTAKAAREQASSGIIDKYSAMVKFSLIFQ
jgi:hypothetical protein